MHDPLLLHTTQFNSTRFHVPFLCALGPLFCALSLKLISYSGSLRSLNSARVQMPFSASHIPAPRETNVIVATFHFRLLLSPQGSTPDRAARGSLRMITDTMREKISLHALALALLISEGSLPVASLATVRMQTSYCAAGNGTAA